MIVVPLWDLFVDMVYGVFSVVYFLFRLWDPQDVCCFLFFNGGPLCLPLDFGFWLLFFVFLWGCLVDVVFYSFFVVFNGCVNCDL